MIQRIPSATNFAEGQRSLYGILASLAGMFCGAMAIALVCMLMWGNWPPAEFHTIIVILGWTLGGFIASMAAVIVGLLTGGPVGKFKANVSKDGLGFETDSSSGSTLSTTTTTTVAPPAPGASQ